LHRNEKGLTNIGLYPSPGFSFASGCPMTVPSLEPHGQTSFQAVTRSWSHFAGTGTRLALNRWRQRGGVERTRFRIAFLSTAPLPCRPTGLGPHLPAPALSRFPVRSFRGSPLGLGWWPSLRRRFAAVLSSLRLIGILHFG